MSNKWGVLREIGKFLLFLLALVGLMLLVTLLGGVANSPSFSPYQKYFEFAFEKNGLKELINEILVIAVGISLYSGGLHMYRRRRLIQNLQSIPIRSIPRGLVEVQGKVEPLGPLLETPIEKRPCVWFRFELYRGGGKARKTLLEETQGRPFYVTDETGKILVNPDGATVSDRFWEVKDVFPDRMPAELAARIGGLEKGVLYHYRETLISPDATVYVIGDAQDRPDVSDVEWHTGVSRTQISKQHGRDFTIDIGTEEQVTPRAVWAPFLTIVGIIVLSFSTILLLLIFHAPGAMALTSAALVAVAGVLIAVVVMAIIIYNGLVFLRTSVTKAWSDIDVLLKQRYDEVPNLVATVKGYAAHEKETFEMVTNARAQYLSAQDVHGKIAAEGTLGGGVRHLLMVAEAYPELKADQNFLKLQERLSSIEHEIADRREQYNAVVEQYNTRLASFPDVLFANALRFSPAEFYKAQLPSNAVPSTF